MTNLEGIRLTLSQPENLTPNASTGLADVPSVDVLKSGELYYAEDRDDSDKIIPRLFTKTSKGSDNVADATKDENKIVCLTPHVFSGANKPTKGYRDGDIWIKTVE